MTLPATRVGPMVGMLLLGGLAGLIPAGPAAAQAAAQAAGPRYVYASGFQGVRYYPNTGAAAGARPAAAAPRTSAARGTSVGPGVRDWSTGRRGRLHKPWLQPR